LLLAWIEEAPELPQEFLDDFVVYLLLVGVLRVDVDQ